MFGSAGVGVVQPESPPEAGLLQTDPDQLLRGGRSGRGHASAGSTQLLFPRIVPHFQHVSKYSRYVLPTGLEICASYERAFTGEAHVEIYATVQ